MPTKNIVETISDGMLSTRQNKLERAVVQIRDIYEGMGRVVTVLDSDEGERRQDVSELRAMANKLHKVASVVEDAAREADRLTASTDQQYQIIEVATGQFKENQEALQQIAALIQSSGYDLAHYQTFLQNFREFMAGSPPMVRLALELMDAPLVRQEAAGLPEARRLELIMALDPKARVD